MSLAQRLLELAQREGDFDGRGEGVHAFVVQADMRRFTADSDVQREGAAAGVPDRAPGWLGDDRPDRAHVEAAERREALRAKPAAGLLVRNDDESDPRTGLGGGAGAVDDRRQAALHVGGAPTDEASVLDARLELCSAEGGDDVVVAVQVQKRPAIADAGDDRLPVRLVVAGLDQLVGDRQRVELGADALDAGVVGRARWVLRRNGDEIAGEGDDRVLTKLSRPCSHEANVAPRLAPRAGNC